MPINALNFITVNETKQKNNTNTKTHWRQVIDGENYAYQRVKEYFDNLCGENSVASKAGQITVGTPIAICADAAELSAVTRDFLENPYGTINRFQKHEEQQLNSGIRLIKDLPNKISNWFKQNN